MKKRYTRFAAALLTVSMISTMSLSTFAAKVIKPSSQQTEEQTETSEKVVIRSKTNIDADTDSEPVPSTKSSSTTTKSAVAPKAYKLGKMQIQVPNNWVVNGDETAMFMFAPVSSSVETMMGAMIYDSEAFYADEEDAALSSLNQSYISAVLGVLSEQTEGKSQAETKALLNEYLQQYAQEGQTIELVNHKTHPGVKVIMEEPNGTKGQVIMMVGTDEIIILFGIADNDKSYNSVVSTLNSIISTVKTVK